MIIVVEKKQYDLVIGENAIELFDFYRVFEMHGLSVQDAMKRIAEGGTYIDGLANYHPMDTELIKTPKPFVFINKSALKGDYRDVTLLMHEMVHMALLLNDWEIDEREEEIVAWAETETNDIMASGILDKKKPKPIFPSMF